ncbi:MAG: HD-GYP domain-containing protein [Spirochaetaceae bacterium]|jgi:HD-GYP domain-containing protein (c-di-GMP phosphodiesterase class II)|nr:HD-GYP domain-containing protein [Spirochaetaceae bacterium]
MKEYNVTDIKHGYFFSDPAYLDDGFIVLPMEMPFTGDLGTLLKEWQFFSIKSNGEPRDYYSGKALENKNSYLSMNDAAKVVEAEAYISELERFTVQLYEQIENNSHINFNSITTKVRELCEKVKDDKRYLLQVETKQDSASDPKLFNAAHSVRTAILSIVIGDYIKLPMHRLIELGVAALVHEIGMVKLPPTIYLSSGKLSQKDMEILKQHTVFGYEVLRASNFPVAICITALEHHERESGSGYPRRLTGNNISAYSKIIAVACSYAAITADRPHQDARGGYEGVTDLLRNEGKQYDDTIIRALVFSLSIYPIGQFVLLSNEKKGRVVDVNPYDPRFPIVEVIGDLTPSGKNKIIETSLGGVSIKRPLDKEDV